MVERLKKQKPQIFLILFFLLLSTINYQPSTAYAAIPKLINYQGRLTDSQGKPLADGKYKITFKIYNSDGNPIWTELHDPAQGTGIQIEKGIFNVMLGGVTPLNLTFDQQYALGIQVGSDAEMSPRQLLASSAYAFRAEHGVPKGVIVMWSGSIANIPGGWALCDGTNGTPDLRNKFIKGVPSNSTNPGNTGGSAATTLIEANLPPHKHTGSAHHHNIRNLVGGYSGGNRVAESGLGSVISSNAGTTSWSSWNTSVYAMDDAGTDPTGSGSGSSQPFNILPPYYELAFIMKIE